MLFLEDLNMTTLKLKQTIPKPRSLIRFLFLTTGQIIVFIGECVLATDVLYFSHKEMYWRGWKKNQP